MIRRMKHGEEDSVRALIAKLSFEDQTYWLKPAKTLEEYLKESDRIPINERIKAKSFILVAEENSKIVGLCWCSIVDRGIDKQGEIAEFYVENQYRSKGVGKELIAAAKQLFMNEQVDVAFVWTHHGNKAAIEIYKNAGFKEVDQPVMAFIPAQKNKHDFTMDLTRRN